MEGLTGRIHVPIALAVVWLPLAATTYTGVAADAITYSSARIRWTTDAATLSLIRYGTSPTELNLWKEEPSPGPRAKHYFYLSGLRHSTTHYFQVCAAKNDCDANVRRFVTAALPDPHPAMPELPKQVKDPSLAVVPALPAIDGSTFLVREDCSDLQEMIRRAAASDGALNHQVLIPVNADCAPPSTASYGNANLSTVRLPAKSGPNKDGTGEIIIRPAVEDSQLPPEGVRTGPSFRRAMSTVRNNQLGLREIGIPPTSGSCARGQLWWRFGVGEREWGLYHCSTPENNGYTLVPRTDFKGELPASCQPDTWYFKADARQSVNGIYWCTASGKLYPISLGRLFFISSDPGAHHYRFFGIRFSLVPRKDEQWLADYVYTEGSYYVGMAELHAASHHIYFDRCYFDGLGYPNRIQQMIKSHASQFGFVNNYVENVNFWLPPENRMSNQTETQVLNLTGGKFIRIANNYIESSGFGMISSNDEDGNTEDVEVVRNTFVKLEKYRYGSPENRAANGKFYHARHAIELKRGQRWLIDGNLCDGNWGTVNQGHQIFVWTIPVPDSPEELGVTDIAITNNTLRNTPNGVYVVGHNDSASAQFRITQRILISNNLMYGINGGRVAEGYPAKWGMCWTLLYAPEDVTIRHNTCHNNTGVLPAFLLAQYGPSAGLDFRDNIVTLTANQGYGGVVSPGTPRGTPSLDAEFPGTWRFTHNAIVNLIGEPINQYPMGNYWQTSHWGIGFVDFENNNFRLKDDSMFKGGNPVFANETGPASDNTDAGVDFTALERAQGVVANLSVTPGQTQVMLSYSVPDSRSCQIDVSENADLSSAIRKSDKGAEPGDRSVTVIDLKPSTKYYYRLMCTQPLEGDFTTLSEGVGSTNRRR